MYCIDANFAVTFEVRAGQRQRSGLHEGPSLGSGDVLDEVRRGPTSHRHDVIELVKDDERPAKAHSVGVKVMDPRGIGIHLALDDTIEAFLLYDPLEGALSRYDLIHGEFQFGQRKQSRCKGLSQLKRHVRLSEVLDDLGLQLIT